MTFNMAWDQVIEGLSLPNYIYLSHQIRQEGYAAGPVHKEVPSGRVHIACLFCFGLHWLEHYSPNVSLACAVFLTVSFVSPSHKKVVGSSTDQLKWKRRRLPWGSHEGHEGRENSISLYYMWKKEE